MAITSKQDLKTAFKNGCYPTETDFANAFDSYFHKTEQIPTDSIYVGEDSLSVLLNSKVDTSTFDQLKTLLRYSINAQTSVAELQRLVDIENRLTTENEAISQNAQSIENLNQQYDNLTDIPNTVAQLSQLIEGLSGAITGSLRFVGSLSCAALNELATDEEDIPDAGDYYRVTDNGTILNSTLGDFEVTAGDSVAWSAAGYWVLITNNALDDIYALLNTKADLTMLGYPEFSEDGNYQVDTVVRKGEYLYRFTEEHEAGEWDDNHVTIVTIEYLINSLFQHLTNISETVNTALYNLNEAVNQCNGIKEYVDDAIAAAGMSDVRSVLITQPDYDELETYAKKTIYFIYEPEDEEEEANDEYDGDTNTDPAT